MKNIWPVVFCFLVVYAKAQPAADDPNANGSIERTGQMGKAYLSEVKKVANISYGSDVSLNVNIRKERSFSNNTVSKDVYFSGSNADGACEGYIDASEITDAVNALEFIADSLLPLNPENEIHFAKRFNDSYFVIYASYTPGTGRVFTKGEWEVTLQVNEHDNTGSQGSVHIKRGDVSTLIQILLACKEKLQTF